MPPKRLLNPQQLNNSILYATAFGLFSVVFRRWFVSCGLICRAVSKRPLVLAVGCLIWPSARMCALVSDARSISDSGFWFFSSPGRKAFHIRWTGVVTIPVSSQDAACSKQKKYLEMQLIFSETLSSHEDPVSKEKRRVLRNNTAGPRTIWSDGPDTMHMHLLRPPRDLICAWKATLSTQSIRLKWHVYRACSGFTEAMRSSPRGHVPLFLVWSKNMRRSSFLVWSKNMRCVRMSSYHGLRVWHVIYRV